MHATRYRFRHNFGRLDTRVFRRQISFIGGPYVRRVRRIYEPAVRARGRCRLQLLELEAGSCTIWDGTQAPLDGNAAGYEDASSRSIRL